MDLLQKSIIMLICIPALVYAMECPADKKLIFRITTRSCDLNWQSFEESVRDKPKEDPQYKFVQEWNNEWEPNKYARKELYEKMGTFSPEIAYAYLLNLFSNQPEHITALKSIMRAAAQAGNIPTLHMLIHMHNEQAQTLAHTRAMHWAVCSNNPEVLECLYKHGALIDEPVQGYTPLGIAAANHYTKSLIRLLDHGANPNTKNECEETPLHYTVRCVSKNMIALIKETISCLLAHGANIWAQNEFGELPLDVAETKYGKQHPLCSFIDQEMHKTKQPYFSNADRYNFINTVMQDDIVEVALWLEKGMSVNTRSLDFDGLTPLMLAASFNNADLVQFLLNKGADPTMKDPCNDDMTAVDYTENKKIRALFNELKAS